jgi:hypothetical protein
MSKWSLVSPPITLPVPGAVATPSLLNLLQVREYVTTSLWGGLSAVVPPRKLTNLARIGSAAYADTLWYFQGQRTLPVSLTIDDAPGT